MTFPPQSLATWDEAWAQDQAQLRSCLLDASRGRATAVYGIGSTAVAGLASQPVIDALIVCPPGEHLEEAVWLIQGLNFRPFAKLGEPFEDVQRLIKPRSGCPTHQVFLAPEGSPFIESAVGFRDWLIRNPTDAHRFAELKAYLHDLFESDPDSYEAGKASFYRHIEARRQAALQASLT